MENRIFLGCNYNDKAIKRQFDNIKENIEKKHPVQVAIFDKRDSKKAKDIWRDIKQEITSSQFTVFDLTGFRPNVVLELGFALAQKDEDQIIISYRTRKKMGQTTQWLLSDIGHLLRHDYKSITELEKFISTEIEKIPYMQKVDDYKKICDRTGSPDKYKEYGLIIIKAIRDNGPITRDKITSILRGSNLRVNSVIFYLKKAKLAVCQKGKRGLLTIP